MKNMFPNQKGIVQIPLAIVIIAIIGIASVGAGVLFHQIQKHKVEQSLTADVSRAVSESQYTPLPTEDTQAEETQIDEQDINVEETYRVTEPIPITYTKTDIDFWRLNLTDVNWAITNWESFRNIKQFNQDDVEKILSLAYKERAIVHNILSKMESGRLLTNEDRNSIDEFYELFRQRYALDAELMSQFSGAKDKRQADLKNAEEIKAQTISFLNKILLEWHFLEEVVVIEIEYMDEMLAILVNENDEASNLFRSLTTIRKERLGKQQDSLGSVISLSEKLKIAIEKEKVSKFINALTPEQRFADDINALNISRSKFEEDRASYDRLLESYKAILGL